MFLSGMFGVCTFLVYVVVLYVAGREGCGIVSQERSDKVEFYMQRVGLVQCFRDNCVFMTY